MGLSPDFSQRPLPVSQTEGIAKALEAIRQLTIIVEVAPLNSTHVQQVLAAKNRDFEDALITKNRLNFSALIGYLNQKAKDLELIARDGIRLRVYGLDLTDPPLEPAHRKSLKTEPKS